MVTPKSNVELADLLRCWLEGDERAGAELVSTFRSDLLAFFRRRVDAGAVEDFVQETIASTLAARDRIRTREQLRSYAFTIAYRLSVDNIRQSARKTRVERLLMPVERRLVTSPSSHFRRRNDHERLEKALEDLPEHQYRVLESYYWHGMSTQEIAIRENIPRGTVKWILSEGRKALRAAIDGD